MATSHRFYVGLRFIIAAFTATLQSALLTFYNNAAEVIRKATDERQEQGIEVFEWLYVPPQFQILVVTGVGIVTMIAIFLMERRNISRIDLMVERGKNLESELNLREGQYSHFNKPGRLNIFTYTWSISIVYGGIFAMWIFLFTIHIVPLLRKE